MNNNFSVRKLIAVEELGLCPSSRQGEPVRDAELLLTTEEMDQLIRSGLSLENFPEWAPEVYSAIRSVVTAPTFPCFFAPQAWKSGLPQFAFLDSPTSSRSIEIGLQLVTDYLRQIGDRKDWDEANSVLFIAFAPVKPPQSLATYRWDAWQFLFGMQALDPIGWPAGIPTDISSADWAFPIAGVPMFVNVSCPAFHLRRSRNLGPALTLVMQPRAPFDKIAGNTKAGRATRSSIRKRLSQYDQIEASPALGTYGDPGARESDQYCFRDDNTREVDRCPFHFAITIPTKEEQ